MQLPSNKVGLVLISVVLVIAGTIFFSKIKAVKPTVDLKNVELIVTRNTDSTFKAGDSDSDGLTDWLEEFYHTDPKNPDTDGDGTSDGDEVSLDRDPSVAGPNDPLLTREDLISTDIGTSTPGSLTDKASIELFSQYMLLKKQGNLKPEDEKNLVDQISKKVSTEASLKDKYVKSDILNTTSTTETITIYGDRVAQIALDFFLELDSYKNFQDSVYLMKISEAYKNYADNLLQISVPGVLQDVHLAFVNYMYKTGIFFEVLAKTDADPMTSLVVTTQYKATQLSEQQLYTTLGSYFKNNGIIFDTESTDRFWKNFQN